MTARVSPIRRAFYVALPVGILISLTIFACGNDRPNASGDGTFIPPGSPSSCGTPNEGCDCVEPGKIVECGEVSRTSPDGFVACSMGHRQCLGGRWGACMGETDVIKTRTFVAAGGVGTLSLGGSAACGADGGGPADPCDPYCNGFVDDPTGLTPPGGLVVADGGLTVGPGDAGGDAGAPGVFAATAGGVVSCGGATNINGPACVPPGLTTCQQDWRCNGATNTCIWNGGPGYYNPAAGGVDLTVGAPCGPSGSGSATAPVCNRGSATLLAGASITFHVTAGLPSGCANLGAPTLTGTLLADLAPGACTSFALGNSMGNKVITVNAGAPGAVAEAPGLCANNSAVFKDDGAPGCGTCVACSTQVTGKVYDPTGAPPTAGANNLPLAGISVFQPSGALTPLVDGTTCDTCTSTDSPFITKATTNANGAFTLNNVAPGTNVPIVVQSGRWRRKVVLPTVNACAVTTPVAGTFRMPKNKVEGDIPKTAVVTAQDESLACLIRKIGVDIGEVGGSAGAGDTKRVELFRHNGMTTVGPVAPAASTLYNAANLSRFSAVIMDCPDTVDGTPLAAQRTALRNFVNAGGRMFADHWAGDYLIHTPEWPVTSTWNSVIGGTTLPARGRIITGTGPQQLFNDWLFNVGASADYGAGWLRVDEAKQNARIPAAGTVTWLRGQTSNAWGPGAPPGAPSNGGDYELSYSFDTPFPGGNCGVPGGTGRFIFNGMHVNPSRGTTGTFPGACNLGLSLVPEEKALIYQFFQLTACQLGGATPPPPPPPPPALTPVVYTRDYLAVCTTGERVKWGPFYWQAGIPAGTSIVFNAATAATLGGLAPAPPISPPPVTAVVGTAALTTAPPGAWDCNGCPGAPVSVDSQLLTQTMGPSQEYLRIYMNFLPTATTPPTLYSWRQVYDCVPAE